MADGSAKTSPLLLVSTAASVIACVGVIWLSLRVGALEERRANAPPRDLESDAAATALPPAPVPTAAQAPAELDAEAFQKQWRDHASQRAKAQCYAEAAAAPEIELALRLGPTGAVLVATATAESARAAPELSQCVADVVRNIQWQAPGRLVQGTVKLRPP